MPKRAVRSLPSRNRRNRESPEAPPSDHGRTRTCLPLIDQTEAPEHEKTQAGDDEVPGGGERLTGGRSGDTEAGYDTLYVS